MLSKFLALGMPLEVVIRRATLAPAQTIRRDRDQCAGGAIGTLRVGAPADLAVFAVEEGEFEFADTLGQRLTGSRRLVNALTLRAGREMDRTQDYGALPIFTRPRR